LKATGLVGVTAALGGAATAQSTQVDQPVSATYVLGGETEHWYGLSPTADDFHGRENPPLKLRVGERYRVVWINLDGALHEFQILDGTGRPLVETEATDVVGETREVAFTASPDMARYRCEYHPQTMVAAVQLGGEYGTESGATGNHSAGHQGPGQGGQTGTHPHGTHG
jgi:hypothetical protein